MNVTRLAAAAVAIAGAIAGGLWDRAPAAGPSKDAFGYVLVGDFHVHGYPVDGALPPWEVGREARRRGLDVVALLGHNQLVSGRAGAAFSTGNVLIIPGQEVTAPGFHMAAVGLSHSVDWRLPAGDAIDAIHAQGGIAIAAHPAVPSWSGIPNAVLARLDGSEAAHPVVQFVKGSDVELALFRARVLRVNPHVAPIGSSDFHFTPSMGSYRTYVLADAFTTAGVLDAIRQGRTVAEDPERRLTGTPQNVARVEHFLADHPRPAGPTIPQRAAAGLVLLALAVFVLKT